MLYVEGKPTKVSPTLKEAKEQAAAYLPAGVPLKIESHVAPAPSQAWNYDHTLQQWVEQR
ncbi:hypothetical protein [Sinimarinibacterium sp. CAU 1509]|uniref:hypothetical protein n=1 Tax=Sinimarinibacterium sp. CAU 1509 TaxID=2562283 RepID=UPI001B7FE523|nr:hypothetical protein [Sinimarinibacterium sp. CAU 1509]